MSRYLQILWVFSVLSVLGFGGGKGIIPQMHHDVVDQYQWVTNDQFTQFYTIGKLVPGPTTVFATLIGYAAMGGHGAQAILGALVATIGMFVPSSLIMIGADRLWEKFGESPWRVIISHGLAPAIVGLVWSSVYTISHGTASGLIAYALALAVTIASLRTKLSAPVLIALSGAAGVVLFRT